MTLDATKSGISRWDALAIAEIDILWMTVGLRSDGDTIVVTAPTQPSIEDLVLRSSVSAKTGEGMPECLEFLESRRVPSRAAAPVGTK
jgi:hypothetical protein